MGTWSLLFLLLILTCLNEKRASAQSTTTENLDNVRGTVINSVTHEAISRALVFSPDNRFATLTDSQGRFEFTLTKTETNLERDPYSGLPLSGRVLIVNRVRPDMLMARKPGFLSNQNNPAQNLLNQAGKELTIPLTPEALIVGTVSLPTSEAPDSITLQIYRRQVQDGRAHWVPVGVTQSKSNGEFRFAELPAGTYKLLTSELLDRDPLNFNQREQLYGYPPVYYHAAPDFDSASTIQVSAGETGQANLSLVKQPYYLVKVAVIDAPLDNGIAVNVYAQGRRGPGYSLGYNSRDQAIEGMLPNGTYTIEASSFAPRAASGLFNLTVKGAADQGSRMVLVPNSSIPVNVKEEFTSADNTGAASWNINGRNIVVKGPRRYLNVMLEPADDFGQRGGASLRGPTGPGDEALVLENVRPGRYWVRVNSSRGFTASVRSGNIDLQRQLLVVGAGGAVSPIEITMRDDTAEIEGTIEGITPPASTISSEAERTAFPDRINSAPAPAAHLYCIPLPEGGGQFTEAWVSPDGSFSAPQLPPGAYRLLAFDRPQPDLDYRNPEAMQAYDAKGPVVRLSGGQKEHVRLQLISTSE